MNLFSASCIFVSVSNAIILFLATFRSDDAKATSIWRFFSFAVIVWAVGGFFGSSSSDYNKALLGWQVGISGTIFTVVFYVHFVLKYLGLKKKTFIKYVYALGFLFLFLNWYGHSKYFIGGLRYEFNQLYWIDWFQNKNPAWLFFYFYFYVVLLVYSFLLLLRAFKHSKGVFRNQLKYFILGSIMGWFGTQPVHLLVFRIGIYPFSNFLIGLYTFIFGFAILKYRLMDIKVALTRAGIFIGVYTIVLGIPFAAAISFREQLIAILGSSWWMSPLILMAVLATGGPFIYIYVQRKAEDKLLREQKRYQDSLKQASIGMTRIRNIGKLLDLITHIVTRTVKISYAAIYLYKEQSNEYVLEVMRDKGRIPIPRVPYDYPLAAWIMFEREPLIYEEVKRQMENTNDETYKHLEKNMRELTASVIIPSFLEDRLIGFFVLGDKISGQIYTSEDLNVFQVLASQAALAIENAQFYEEAKEKQQQLAQAEKMATIGTMADGLSHQINNRLHCLGLIAADTVDTIKRTDTSKCTSEVKEMIEDISHALSRIQVNVNQGGQVVQGVLKYSRPGQIGLEPLSLDQILDATIDVVQHKVKLIEFDLIRDYPKDTPKIKGNLAQLEEVFFNFIDNAYDAIVERRVTLEEKAYRGKVTISAHRTKDDMLEITIEDNGMGIKTEDIKKPFTPFFTTKTSSRKGTGLGLYVMQKIITDPDIHKGKIWFESEYKKGTRFFVQLHLA